MKTEKIKYEDFLKIINSLNIKIDIDSKFLYEIYETVIDGINDVMSVNPDYKFVPVNHLVVVFYIVHEYLYTIEGLDEKNIKNLKEDEDLASGLASLCCDKYFTNEQLSFQSPSFINKFDPLISTLNLYLNFNLTVINKTSPQSKESDLFKKMLSKSFTLGKCIIDLILNGFETEAFSTWRTLHESECILICLAKYGQKMIDKYFEHIKYALAYRHQIEKEETDKIFEKIKSEMKEHDLKSKDMKKYIEYGYLFVVPDYVEKQYKLNFRDGIERAADLEIYSKTYEMSSEIAHSSALMLFSDDSYFSGLTMLSLYESFFRLENIFKSYLKSMINENEFNSYLAMSAVYKKQLEIIYNKTKNKFINFYKVNTQDNI